MNNSQEISDYLNQNVKEKKYFYTLFAYREDAQLLAENYQLMQNPFVDTLYEEALKLLNTGKIAFDLDQGFKKLKSHYPDFKVPKIQAVYSAFGKDIFLSDSLFVLGLDYYLGEQASYRPNVYEYIKARLTPDHLVPQVFQFLSLNFNKTKKGRRNVLDEMIYSGKAMEFAREMLPCVSDSLIIGYSSQDFANATVSEAIIWSHFLEKQLLYDESTKAILRYVDESLRYLKLTKNVPVE